MSTKRLLVPALPLALLVTLGATVAPANAQTAPLIPFGSTWRYTKTAQPSSEWTSTFYADDAWSSGPAPIGHLDPMATDFGTVPVTSYYRKAFAVSNAGAYTNLTLRFRADDGAVAYLNGTELRRTNMPDGTVTPTTRTLQIDNWDGKYVHTVDVNPSLLRSGTNVLSLEVHAAGNSSWTSADSTMEAGLEGSADPSVAAPIMPLPPPPPPPSPAPPPPPAVPAGWRLAWADEFDGSSLDTSRWAPYNNAYGSADPNSLHCMTPNNLSVSSGTLKITARQQAVTCSNGQAYSYTSGMVDSRSVGHLYPLYGRYEMRVRVPHGQGLWPGLWLRHANGGAGTAEVDILEVFHASRPGQATQTLHFPSTLGYNVAQRGTPFETAVPGRGDWHTFAIDVTPVRPGDDSSMLFRFSIDGRTTLEYRNDRAAILAAGDKNAAWDIALDLFVGGTWAGNPDRDLGYYPANGGICAQTDKAPPGGNRAACPTNGIWLAPWNDSIFEVDYVRVYTPA